MEATNKYESRRSISSDSDTLSVAGEIHENFKKHLAFKAIEEERH